MENPMKRKFIENISIIPYKPEYAVYFDHFNKAWLKEYFSVEPIDKYVLENPEQAILKPGGAILFAENKGRIIGTVAIKLIQPGIFELTKMAVDKKYQGLGAGRALCIAAIEEAKKLNAHTLILYSQKQLTNAISLYYKMGFMELPLEKGVYQRADIKMGMPINK
jgi:ribosomal protein S18 acetylase RimI-like enzyme